jgi:hypothetical protein
MSLFSIQPYQKSQKTHVGISEDSKTEFGALLFFVIVGGAVWFFIQSSKWEDPMPETVR